MEYITLTIGTLEEITHDFRWSDDAKQNMKRTTEKVFPDDVTPQNLFTFIGLALGAIADKDHSVTVTLPETSQGMSPWEQLEARIDALYLLGEEAYHMGICGCDEEHENEERVH